MPKPKEEVVDVTARNVSAQLAMLVKRVAALEHAAGLNRPKRPSEAE